MCARRTGAASQTFERMHNTLSHRVKTYVPVSNSGAARQAIERTHTHASIWKNYTITEGSMCVHTNKICKHAYIHTHRYKQNAQAA